VDQISLASLGGRLRQERLRQQIELPALAQRLHMRPDQIEALETGDRGRWPEQAFAIAQLRRLAEALKLDPEPLVADLRELLSKQPSDQPSLAASAVMRAGELRGNSQVPREEGRRDWISATAPPPKPWLKPLALLALLGIGGIGAMLFLLRSQPKPAGLPSAAPRKQSLAKPPKPLQTPPKPGATSLQLSSKETVWLAVRELPNQKMLFQGNLSGVKSFPLGLGLQVRAGRPDLVQVQLNGQTKGVLGPIERIAWVTLTPPKGAPGANPKL
jgi:transcriptional regulator with XRE-family HTH domain